MRAQLGLHEDDIVFLQATRIVRRKGIEHTLSLVAKLKDHRCKLVISHEAGDEGQEYAGWLKQEAQEMGVDLRIFSIEMRDPWNDAQDTAAGNTLLDIYPCADFVTYPSLYEGYGNAFPEAVYFRKPVLINRYSIVIRDIEPKGFDLVVMDGLLTKTEVQSILMDLSSNLDLFEYYQKKLEVSGKKQSS